MSTHQLLDLEHKIISFRNKRKWKKYHTIKNLLISLIVETGELFEIFQWKTEKEIKNFVRDKKIKTKIADELADVAIYLITLAHDLRIDLGEAIENKIEKNERKYPVKLVKGKYVKYTELRRSKDGS